MEQHSDNILELGDRVVRLEPNLPGRREQFASFCQRLSVLLKTDESTHRRRGLQQAREEIETLGGVAPSRADVALRFACSVITDVVAQGWRVSVLGGNIELRSPSIDGASPEEVKRRVREGHLLERDAQLREPAVREFIRSMEQRRLGPTGWVSIFSLMRDGRQLANQLGAAMQSKNEKQQLMWLRQSISPYLQRVEAEALCVHTGLKLTDIWRYFRHTWVNTYKSIPGRGMMVLIRDAAAPNHPIIGIAALGSSMAQQTLRDRWIGWDSDVFERAVRENPDARFAKWIFDSVQRLIESIHISDLISDGVIERYELKKPSDLTIGRLTREAARASEDHRRFPNAAAHKKNGKSIDWNKQASTSLFRSKRAKTLALLLGIRRDLQIAGFDHRKPATLQKAILTSSGQSAVRQLIRLVKAEHAGVDMMDIIVCGAVAPYNVLLGGKLVCLLLTSPEIVQFYRDKYRDQESVIASSMKGEAVNRPPNLVLLATTSLYGIGSSQYNRIRVPLEELGLEKTDSIEYRELGVSKGFGSYQFSKASIDYVEILLGRSGNGRKVNSIFGEGVNPLMRKIRDGLNIVGLPADVLLRHGNARVVYGVPLAQNFREVLLGFASRPKYLLSLHQAPNQTAKLAAHWRRRWLARRICRPDVLSEVARHTLTYPIVHGARVRHDESAPSPEEDLFKSMSAPLPAGQPA
jgi:Domain of unknown function (DUF4338)